MCVTTYSMTQDSQATPIPILNPCSVSELKRVPDFDSVCPRCKKRYISTTELCVEISLASVKRTTWFWHSKTTGCQGPSSIEIVDLTFPDEEEGESQVTYQ